MDSTSYTNSRPLAEALARCARGESSKLLSHIECSRADVAICGTTTVAHSYYLKSNGNDQVVTAELACFLAEQIIDYAIPRQKIIDAHEEMTRTGASDVFVKLQKEAKQLFVSSKTSGEAGELLLYSFAEHVFRFPQLLSKMSLKTSGEMHYHGADGVFASARNDDSLDLYWGEAKIHANVSSAIREAFRSLAPYLIESRANTSKRSRDLFLVNENLDLGDTDFTEHIKSFFLPNTEQSRAIRYCGLALVGFDSAVYHDMATVGKSVDTEFRLNLKKIQNAVSVNFLENFEIHIICLPFTSVDEFRKFFASELGLSDAT